MKFYVFIREYPISGNNRVEFPTYSLKCCWTSLTLFIVVQHYSRTSTNHVASFHPFCWSLALPLLRHQQGPGTSSPALPFPSLRCCAAARATVARTVGRVGLSQTPAQSNNHRDHLGLKLGYCSRIRRRATMVTHLRSVQAQPGETFQMRAQKVQYFFRQTHYRHK